jgi:O-Antigen ligase
MRGLLTESRHDPAVISIVGALSLLSVGVLSGQGVRILAPLLLIVTVIAVARRTFIGWDRLIALLLIIVLFVPIGRYRLPASLPFNLELYRLVVVVAVLFWLTSLLVDPRVRLRSTSFDPPLLLILACVLASELTNPGRVGAYGSHVIKSLTFLLSFVLVYYLTATTLRTRASIQFLLRLLVIGGTVISVFAIVEQRTHYNVFDHLQSVLPFLIFEGQLYYLTLGSAIRAIGPSQQSIALGAALILLVPPAVYFARTTGRSRWWLAAVVLVVGAMASGSRSAVVMLAVEVIVFLCLKPKETKKLWPALIPTLALVHFALPGMIGGLKASFFPKGGIIAQQSRLERDYDPLLAGGRVRLIKPMLSEASRKPLFGEGYGTRITGFNERDRNAPILDDQWLNNILDVGFVGLAAWIWLVTRAGRRLWRASRTAGQVGDSWLFAALAASVSSFAVGMLTCDALSYTQLTFFFWILLGLSAALLRISMVRPTRAPAYAHSGARWLS